MTSLTNEALKKPEMKRMLLERAFDQVNRLHFDGFLDRPVLAWNSRLRSSAGRFFPGSRKFFKSHPPKIEVATYLLDEKDAIKHIVDTVAHEMIHYWLWVRKKPYSHTDEFWAKMNHMSVNRYNPVPKLSPPKHTYHCPECRKEFKARRKLGVLACLECCKKHAKGKFDPRFILKKCTPTEAR